MITAYGNFSAKLPSGLQYNFSPSLENISKLGSGEDIINTFSRVFCIAAKEWANSLSFIPSCFTKVKRHAGQDSLRASILVLQCCCDEDITPMVGGWKSRRGKMIYQPGFESPQTIITLAEHLLIHGVVGKTKKKRKKSESKKTAEFNPAEYANMARVHLGLSRDEAWSLTVSEFIDLMDAKFPDKGESEGYFIGKDEYKKKMAAAKAAREKAGVK